MCGPNHDKRQRTSRNFDCNHETDFRADCEPNSGSDGKLFRLAPEDHVSVSLGQHGLKYKAIELRDRKRYRCLYVRTETEPSQEFARRGRKIQTEFVQMQIETFNKRAKELGDAVAATTKGRFDKSSN